jgi:hypothetical protein
MSDLQKQIEALKKGIETKANARGKAEAASFSHRRRQDLTAAGHFTAQVAVGAIWSWERVLKPVLALLSIPLSGVFRLYRRLWAKVVYVNDNFGNRIFSKTRAGVMVTASVLFFWFAALPALGFLFDTALYFATVKHDEVVYLNNSQEIIPEENVHSVQGCTELPCSDHNSFYFRIRATPFNEVWSLMHEHTFFFPDYVAAAVPVDVSRCTITSYGIRLKLFMRGMDLYPDVLRTACQPLSQFGQE